MLWLVASLSLAAPVDATVRLTTGASVCAGVVIDTDRVATAYHCVASGGRPLVETVDGRAAVGWVVAARPADDLALIEVSLSVEPVALAPEAPARGDVVDVVGHPFGTQEPAGYFAGLLMFSQSRGIVSAVGDRAIQITAPVNPGNSGGPVFDAEGRVVGIVSRRLNGDGLGFATRVERLRDLVDAPVRPSPLGGTWGVMATAAAWGGPGGTLSVGGHLYASFRDRVVVSADLALPVSPRWDSLRTEIAWLRTEGRVGLRQRFFRGRWTSHLDAYGGGAEIATVVTDRDTFRRTWTSRWAPSAGVAVGFANVVLDSAWVFDAGEVRWRGQMRFVWPGRLGIF